MSNQDGLFIKSSNDICLGVICDGVGGLEHGELAAIETTLFLRKWFIEYNTGDFKQICQGLCNNINDISKIILCKYNELQLQTATTLSAILLWQDQYFIAHIGDSRIYKVSKDIDLLTQDHTIIQLNMKNGVAFSEKYLSQCIGMKKKLNVFCVNGSLKKGEAFLLCSDGFYNKMPEVKICNQIKNINISTNIEKICTELIANVLQQNEQDNISVGIIKLL